MLNTRDRAGACEAPLGAGTARGEHAPPPPSSAAAAAACSRAARVRGAGPASAGVNTAGVSEPLQKGIKRDAGICEVTAPRLQDALAGGARAPADLLEPACSARERGGLEVAFPGLVLHAAERNPRGQGITSSCH